MPQDEISEFGERIISHLLKENSHLTRERILELLDMKIETPEGEMTPFEESFIARHRDQFPHLTVDEILELLDQFA